MVSRLGTNVLSFAMTSSPKLHMWMAGRRGSNSGQQPQLTGYSPVSIN